MTPPASTQAAARLWTALVMWASQLAKLILAMHAVSHKPPAGSVSAVHMRACTGIKKCPQLRYRSKSDPCSYELFCLESLILSFPRVMQIPPESPCITQLNINPHSMFLCETIKFAKKNPLECRKCKMKTAGCGSEKFSHDGGKPYIQKHYIWTCNMQRTLKPKNSWHAHKDHQTGCACWLGLLKYLDVNSDWNLASVIDCHPPVFSTLFYSTYVQTPCPNSPAKCLNKCFSRHSESEETGGSHFTAEKQTYMWRDTLWLITLSRKPT